MQHHCSTKNKYLRLPMRLLVTSESNRVASGSTSPSLEAVTKYTYVNVRVAKLGCQPAQPTPALAALAELITEQT